MITCPKCGFKDHIEGAVFCQNCGQHIGINYCTNPDCPKGVQPRLPEDARFCPFCGKAYKRNTSNGSVGWNCSTYLSQGKAYCHGKRYRNPR